MPPRSDKKNAPQKIREIPVEVKSSIPLDSPSGDFSYLTSRLTEFPLTVKNPSPKSFYPVLASLAHANHLDLQYRIFPETPDRLSVGTISEEFLGKVSEICGTWNFGCYFYQQGKFAAYKWPVEYKDLDIPALLGYTPVRPVLILGFFK